MWGECRDKVDWIAITLCITLHLLLYDSAVSPHPKNGLFSTEAWLSNSFMQVIQNHEVVRFFAVSIHVHVPRVFGEGSTMPRDQTLKSFWGQHKDFWMCSQYYPGPDSEDMLCQTMPFPEKSRRIRESVLSFRIDGLFFPSTNLTSHLLNNS